MIGLSSTPLDLADRRYTHDPIYPDDDCMVCGNHRRRHLADGACPHTADSLTDEQIHQWWRTGGRGGSFVDAVNASTEIRRAVNQGRSGNGKPLFAPTAEEIEESRRLIADALNAAG